MWMKNCFWLQRHIVPRVVGLEVWDSEGETTAEEVMTCHHHQFCVNFRRSPGGICWVTIPTASSYFVHFASWGVWKHGTDDSLEDPIYVGPDDLGFVDDDSSHSIKALKQPLNIRINIYKYHSANLGAEF